MAKFVTKLRSVTELVTKLKEPSDNVWVLVSPLVYESDLIGRVYIPDGFQTDLASVPRLPIVYAIWGYRAHREAVIHDAMYRIDFPGDVTYSVANSVFLEAMESTGKAWYIRWPMYWAVCSGGWTSWHKHLMADNIS